MKKKQQGFLLFEFLLTSLLSSFLLLIIYQSYRTVNNGVQYIRHAADFQMQKNLFLYQIELDALSIVIPDAVYTLYGKIKENKSNYNDKTTVGKEVDIDNEKDKKKLEKEFNALSSFLPEVKNTAEEKKISWISSRKMLGKSQLVKITYVFKLTEKIYKEKKLYRLYRKEDDIDQNGVVTKNNKEYVMINYILAPDIVVLLPGIDFDIEKKNSEKSTSDKKEEDFFIDWATKPVFIAVKELIIPEMKELHKKIVVPFGIVFNGSMIAYDLSKELDFQVAISFPNADYALQMLCNRKVKKEDKKDDKQEGAKDEKKDDKVSSNTPIKPNEVINTPIGSSALVGQINSSNPLINNN